MTRTRAREPWPVDPATPLAHVPFCVLDLETTGSGRDDAITELGAVKVVGGRCEGTFQTLVNPGRGVAPFVTMLTGITEAMLVPAPRIDAALPALVEFARGCVVVGHNVGFDLGFLDAACDRLGYPRFARPALDTLALARRLLREEVPDCRLATLAEHLRLDHQPSHRALSDALATTDLLHALVERATAWDCWALDDLVQLPRLGRHPYATKLRLTTDLPRQPGVYRFVGTAGEVLYVGTATNLRTRVRSYFGSDDRRMIQPLLRGLQAVDHTVLPHPLLAQVLEVRELHRLRPRYNRRGARPQHRAYVHLTQEPYPRLRVVRRPARTGVHLGPLPSSASAARVVEAIQHVVPLRRCATALRSEPVRDTPCLAAQLGVSECPCSGQVDAARYAKAVADAAAVLRGEPAAVDAAVGALSLRIDRLAGARRFEEAALTRDRLAALTAALERARRIHELVEAGTQQVWLGPDLTVTIDSGRLVAGAGFEARAAPDAPLPGRPPDPAYADEAVVISRWLQRQRRARAADAA